MSYMVIYKLYEWHVVQGKMKAMLKFEQHFRDCMEVIGARLVGGFSTVAGRTYERKTGRLITIIAFDSRRELATATKSILGALLLERLLKKASQMCTDVKVSVLRPTRGSNS